jgi:cytochrome c oxidase assembly protein subunit 15
LAGWLMVKSGLQDLPRVDPFRLAIHLLLALATFSYCCWMLFHHHFPSRPQAEPRAISRPLAWLFALALLLQILCGALLAGGKAGHLYPQYPLMAGELLPRAAWQLNPLWLNPLHNPVMIHFLHRHLPLLLLLLAAALASNLARGKHPDRLRTRASFALLTLLLLQFCLGIAALLFHVPTLLASLHQCNAFLLWASCLLLLQRLTPHQWLPLAKSWQP